MIFRRKDFLDIKFDESLDLLFFCIRCKYFNNIAFGNIDLLNIYRMEHFYLLTLIRKMKREHSSLKIFVFVMRRILFQTRYSLNKEAGGGGVNRSVPRWSLAGGQEICFAVTDERRIIISHSVETSNISPSATRRHRRHRRRQSGPMMSAHRTKSVSGRTVPRNDLLRHGAWRNSWNERSVTRDERYITDTGWMNRCHLAKTRNVPSGASHSRIGKSAFIRAWKME